MATVEPLKMTSLEAALQTRLGATSHRWVAVCIEAPPGAARRLLNLKETEETVYFTSGRGPGSGAVERDSRSTFVGIGALVSRRFEGSARLREAEAFVTRTFADFDIQADMKPLVRFFGGVSFSPGRDGSGRCWAEFGDARFMLPRCLYVDDESEPDEPARLICTASDVDIARTLSLAARVLDECGCGDSGPESIPPRPIERTSDDSAPQESFARLVEGIRTEIDRGVVEKIVAARRITLKLSAPPEPAAILRHMNAHAPLCARFCLRVGEKTFVGATPERLIERRGSELRTEALAGSIGAGEPSAEERLLASEKDRREHAFVVDAIREALAPICSDLDAPEEPGTRRLESIVHLRTPIHARLAEKAHILSLVERLHPTPAVGGLPRDRAVEFIRTHEVAERGWYAAPFGWVDANGDGEFVVALRSGLISGDKVHLYAGAGIVRGSDSDAEYAETELKLAGMLSALGLDPLATRGEKTDRSRSGPHLGAVDR